MLYETIELYTKPDCIFCVKAKALLQQEGLYYVEYKLNEDFTREDLLNKVPTAKTYPVILINGAHIGGAQELSLLVEQSKQKQTKTFLI